MDVAETLTTLLEREHHEIDAGVASFVTGRQRGETKVAELARAATALRRHIYLEEEFLFPPLRSAGMLPPVLVMLREHGEIWRTLDAIDGALGSAGDTAAVSALCSELLVQLEQHNAKEEPIIYPQGDAVLTEEAKGDLRAFLESGEMPPGWVCAQAPRS